MPIGQVGDDGDQTLRAGLAADGIDVSGVKGDVGSRCRRGDDPGRGHRVNRIVLAPGANGALNPADIDAQSAAIAGAALLVVQLEVPLPVAARDALARAAGVPVLLNPAPAAKLPDDLWSQVDILVPNESEASLISGIEVKDAPSAFAAVAPAGVARRRVRAGDAAPTASPWSTMRVSAICRRRWSRRRYDRRRRYVHRRIRRRTARGLSVDDAAALGQRASALCVTHTGHSRRSLTAAKSEALRR